MAKKWRGVACHTGDSSHNITVLVTVFHPCNAQYGPWTPLRCFQYTQDGYLICVLLLVLVL